MVGVSVWSLLDVLCMTFDSFSTNDTSLPDHGQPLHSPTYPGPIIGPRQSRPSRLFHQRLSAVSLATCVACNPSHSIDMSSLELQDLSYTPPSSSSVGQDHSRHHPARRQTSDDTATILDQPSPALVGLGLQELHPVDTGRNAWLFLAASTLIETLTWGVPFSVGILHRYWTSERFVNQDGTISPEDEQLLTLAASLQVRTLSFD